MVSQATLSNPVCWTARTRLLYSHVIVPFMAHIQSCMEWFTKATKTRVLFDFQLLTFPIKWLNFSHGFVLQTTNTGEQPSMTSLYGGSMSMSSAEWEKRARSSRPPAQIRDLLFTRWPRPWPDSYVELLPLYTHYLLCSCQGWVDGSSTVAFMI